MKRSSKTRSILGLLAIFLLLGASPLYADEYLPLEIGNYWSYLSEGSLVETRVVSEQVTMFDQDVFAIDYTESPHNQGLRNFWTSGDDGDVFLHGFENGLGLYYDPPITIVDAPLYLGKTWTSTVDVYTLPDTAYYSTWDIKFSVLEEGLYQVGAGSFPGFGLGNPEPTSGSRQLKGYSFDGQILGASKSEADHWYSNGIGEIQYDTDELYYLESHSGGTTPTASLAWDGVKALFR